MRPRKQKTIAVMDAYARRDERRRTCLSHARRAAMQQRCKMRAYAKRGKRRICDDAPLPLPCRPICATTAPSSPRRDVPPFAAVDDAIAADIVVARVVDALI